MNKLTPTQKIILKWPSRRALADDLRDKDGNPVDLYTVHKWFRRSSIPAFYDSQIVHSAAKRAVSVSLVDLMDARFGHNDQHGHTKTAIQGRAAQ